MTFLTFAILNSNVVNESFAQNISTSLFQVLFIIISLVKVRKKGLEGILHVQTNKTKVESQTPINPSTLIMARRNLAGSVIGGIRETQEMLDFCSKHNIASDIEVTPVQKVNEAYERVVKSDVRYRFVINMKSL